MTARGLIGTLLTLIASLALVALSHRRLRELRDVSRWAAPRLARGHDAPGSEAERRAWVAELNEATLDVQAQVERPGVVPRACAKAAFSLGAAVALIQAIRSLESETLGAWLVPVLSLAGGGAGAWGCWLIGRAAEHEAQRLRSGWNALIRRSSRDVAS